MADSIHKSEQLATEEELHYHDTHQPIRLTQRGERLLVGIAAVVGIYATYAAAQYADPDLTCQGTTTYQMGEHPTYDQLAGEIKVRDGLRASVGRITEMLMDENPNKNPGELQPNDTLEGPTHCTDKVEIVPFS